MRVDAVLGQLLHEPLGLVQRQELGYAHANERRLVGILELLVHLADDGERLLELVRHHVRIEVSHADERRKLFDKFS